MLLFLVVASVVAFFVQTIIHEASHGIIPKLRGCPVMLRVLPGVVNGRFLFGICTWEGHLTDSEVGWTLMLPRLVDLGIIVLTAILAPLHILFLVWLVAATVDFTYNTLGIFRPVGYHNDAWDSLAYLKLDKNVRVARLFSVLAVLMVLSITTWRVVVGTQHLFA